MPSHNASLDPAALKTRQRALRDGFPDALGLRVHRSISWLTRAEREEHSDVRFILLWIGFNAAYADNIGRAIDNASSERDVFAAFFDTLGGFDGKRRIYGAVWQRFSQEIRVLLSNQYIYTPFWKHQNGEPDYSDWSERLDRSKVAVSAALSRQDTTTILSILFDRLYTLRNQLVHGGATFDSAINRAQIRDGCALLGFLLPIFIDLMMDHPDHPWRMPHYPVVE